MSLHQTEAGKDATVSSGGPERPAPGEPDDSGVEEAPANVRSVGSASIYLLPAATLILGLLITTTLVLVSHSQFVNAEKRLIKLRVGDAAALVAASLPGRETPLASAAELADTTNGDVARFKRFVAPYVGTGSGQFASISLWRLAAPQRGPVAVVGVQPELMRSMPDTVAFFSRAAQTRALSVIGLLHSASPRLGFAFTSPGLPGGFGVYGESPLPKNRRSRLQSSSQFTGLNYALYLGTSERPQDLLVTNAENPPPTGRTATETVSFGSTALTLVMSSQAPLSGSLPQRLPWIIGVIGVIVSVGAAVGTLRLIQRRRKAEGLAGRLEIAASENRRLYAEQRSIAQTLQHALLPEHLPQIAGVQTSARYEAGERGMDIGGDWYDVIDLQDGRLLLVVGDVSGRGLQAATTMASLRFAIHAYAAQHDPPPEIMSKLSHLINVAQDGQLATVLCAVVDVDRREISVTSAGHLPPLLITNGTGYYLESEIGLPIGVEEDEAYRSTTISVPRAATLVAFTDGLVEHRGESLDQGLARLRDVASANNVGLPELLSKLVTELQPRPSTDDIAILGLRWTS